MTDVQTTVPRLRMTDITKTFGATTVLDRVSLTIAPGEIHGLVGQNGAGKSTLMKVLGGVLPDHGGTIELDGSPVDVPTPRAALAAGVAVIYQELSLIPAMTVAENIVLGNEVGRVGYDRRSGVRAARRLLERYPALAGLPLERPVAGLGAGTQQMVEIAKALTREAKVLVLDEPTARLSGPERDQLHALIGDLAADGTAVVYISHFLEDVLAVTSSLTVLRNGRVVTTAPTSSFTRASLVQALLSRALLEDEFADRSVPVRSEVAALRAEGLTGAGFTDVDLDVRAGEILGVAGLVGSGRTRLARALTGAARVSAGRLSIAGEPVSFRSPRQSGAAGVVLVPEDRKTDGIIGSASAQENLLLRAFDRSLAPGGFIRTTAARRVAREQIAQLEVQPPRAEQAGAGFSGGNQQKLLIGRALLARPRVLVVDQPTAGVDVGAKAQIHSLIREVAADGCAVIVISDDLDELLSLAHTVAVIDHGRIVATRSRQDIDHDELVELISVPTA